MLSKSLLRTLTRNKQDLFMKSKKDKPLWFVLFCLLVLSVRFVCTQIAVKHLISVSLQCAPNNSASKI